MEMEDEIEITLAVPDEYVASVLIEINDIDAELLDSDEKYIGDNNKIVCKIKSSKEKDFVEWLKSNKITYVI